MKRLEYKRINFMRRLREEQKVSQKKPGPSRKFLPLIVLAALVLLVWGYFFYQTNFVILPQSQDIRDYLALDSTQAAYNNALELEDRCGQLNQQLNLLQDSLDAVESYTQFDSDIYKLIYNKCAGKVTLSGLQFDRATAMLTTGGRAVTVTECAAYVQRLRQTGRFTSLNYYGYTSGEGDYVFQLTMWLPGVVIEEAAEDADGSADDTGAEDTGATDGSADDADATDTGATNTGATDNDDADGTTGAAAEGGGSHD